MCFGFFQLLGTVGIINFAQTTQIILGHVSLGYVQRVPFLVAAKQHGEQEHRDRLQADSDEQVKNENKQPKLSKNETKQTFPKCSQSITLGDI